MKFPISSSVDPQLPDYGHQNLLLLIARYRTLKNGDLSSKSDEDIIKEMVGKASSELTWGDLYFFEIELLKALPFDDLRRVAFLIRRRYRDVAGVDAYEDYQKTVPPEPMGSTTTEEGLRADLVSLVGQIQWLYASAPGLKKSRARLTTIAAIIPFLLLVIVSIFIGKSIPSEQFKWDLPLYMLVIIAGAFGGFLSMQQRFQAVQAIDDPIDDFNNLRNGKISFFASSITGALFALVLYMIFAAKLVQGTIFPEIVTVDKIEITNETKTANTSKYADTTKSTNNIKIVKPADTTKPSSSPKPAETVKSTNKPNHVDTAKSTNEDKRTLGFEEFAKQTGVNSGINYALLLVWSFLAGFAERLVPDTLSWLIEKKDSTLSTKKTS